jgi:hypothetical protein
LTGHLITPKEQETATALEQSLDRSEKIALDLLENRITWGEFNKLRKESYKTYVEDTARINSKYK